MNVKTKHSRLHFARAPPPPALPFPFENDRYLPSRHLI